MINFDIILIRPDILVKTFKTSFPPFEYLFLAPKLAKEGYEVKVFDLQVDTFSNLKKLIKNTSPIWVGITTAAGPQIKGAIKAAKIVRENNPEIPIVWGGPQPTLLPNQTVENELIDVAVRGEGERTVIELTKTFEEKGDLKKVDGITFQEYGDTYSTPDRPFIKNGAEWDAEVEYDWSFVDIKNYINRVDGYKNIPFITSRGCPYRCAFCWNNKAQKSRWRGWSADGAIREIKKILPYVDYITFDDDNFGVSIPRLKQIAYFLKSEDVKWSADSGFRVGKHINDDLMKTLKETNCDHIAFGSETGSQKMLDFIRKDITVEQIRDSGKITGKYGIGAKYSWIFGFPNETKEDILQTINLIDEITELNPNTTHVPNIYYPYPGTFLFDEAIKLGWKKPKILEDWGVLREEVELPYIDDIWYLRSICYSCNFHLATNPSARTYYQTKKIYKLAFDIIKQTSRYRWKNRAFGFPLEFKFMMKTKKLIEIAHS